MATCSTVQIDSTPTRSAVCARCVSISGNANGPALAYMTPNFMAPCYYDRLPERKKPPLRSLEQPHEIGAALIMSWGPRMDLRNGARNGGRGAPRSAYGGRSRQYGLGALGR